MKLFLIIFFSIFVTGCSTSQIQPNGVETNSFSNKEERSLDARWVWISESPENKFFYRPDSVRFYSDSIDFSILMETKDNSKREAKGSISLKCNENVIGYSEEINSSNMTFSRIENGTVTHDLREKLCGTSFANGILVFLAGDLTIDYETGLSLWLAKDYIKSHDKLGKVRSGNAAYRTLSGPDRLLTVWADCEQFRISFSNYPNSQKPISVLWRDVEAISYHDPNNFNIDNAVFVHLCFPKFGKIVYADSNGNEIFSPNSKWIDASEYSLLRKKLDNIDSKYRKNFKLETIPRGGEMSDSEARFCIYQSKRLEKMRESRVRSRFFGIVFDEWSAACGSAIISSDLKKKIVQELDAGGGRLRKVLEKISTEYQKVLSN
jgi:hypothetical protein